MSTVTTKSYPRLIGLMQLAAKVDETLLDQTTAEDHETIIVIILKYIDIIACSNHGAVVCFISTDSSVFPRIRLLIHAIYIFYSGFISIIRNLYGNV